MHKNTGKPTTDIYELSERLVEAEQTLLEQHKVIQLLRNQIRELAAERRRPIPFRVRG